MHSCGQNRYASAANWDSFHQKKNGDLRVEWSGGDLRPLVSAVKAASTRAATRLQLPRDNLRLLELGCGTSGLAAALQTAMPSNDISASDFSPAVIQRMKAAEPKITWMVEDASTMAACEDASFHVLFAKTLVDCFRTFKQSQQSIVGMVKAAHRVLVPGGVLVLLDKRSANLHWGVKAPAPYQLVSEDRSQPVWYCHELVRPAVNASPARAILSAGLDVLDGRNTCVRSGTSLRALVVKQSPLHQSHKMLAGDKIVAVNGVGDGNVRLMRKELKSRKQSHATVKLERLLSASGWRACVTAKLRTTEALDAEPPKTARDTIRPRIPKLIALKPDGARSGAQTTREATPQYARKTGVTHCAPIPPQTPRIARAARHLGRVSLHVERMQKARQASRPKMQGANGKLLPVLLDHQCVERKSNNPVVSEMDDVCHLFE